MREPQLRKCLYMISLWGSLWGIFLISDSWGRTQTMWVVSSLGWCLRFYKSEEAEQGHGEQTSKHHTSTDFVSAPVFRFLPWFG